MHANFGLFRPLSLYALAMPPHEDSLGKSREASITLYPYGQVAAGEPSVNLSLTVDEAEELSIRLAELVKSCREGVYNENGLAQLEYSKQADLEKAQRILGESAQTA